MKRFLIFFLLLSSLTIQAQQRVGSGYTKAQIDSKINSLSITSIQSVTTTSTAATTAAQTGDGLKLIYEKIATTVTVYLYCSCNPSLITRNGRCARSFVVIIARFLNVIPH